jgi:long-chain acyl-CoA synthetase
MKIKNKKKDILENPWDKYYDKDKRNVIIPDISIYEYFERSCLNREYEIALNYFGDKTSFIELISEIDLCAKALVSQGVRENDVVTICMPNTPEAVIAFYAVNKIGAISNMIHPLSSEEEIKDTLIKTKSTLMISINLSYEKINNIIDETNIYKTIIVSAKDSMPSLLGLGYMLTKEIKLNIPKSNEKYLFWNDFLERGNSYNKDCFKRRKREDDAILLHSGGTTGTPKNIVLTNKNVNTIMEQAKIIFPQIGVGDKFLSILPMFHCFGLVVCIAAPLTLGSTAILIPQFDAKRFDKLIRKYEPTVLAGVPTLFEALITNPYMKNLDMSYVKYIISGGDTLSGEKNKLVNDFLKAHNCNASITQGYGMTETTGPVCFGALGSDKLGSIGIPLPGNKVKILNVETKEEMYPNEIGEICITGPTVMSRYLDNTSATNEILIEHEDGLKWVHTGDLGYMDEDGVVFFAQRLKRMLIVSGYNVYPSHIEEVLLKHEYVENCGVIGVPHPYKVQVPKAFIVLKKGIEANETTTKILKEYCEKNLSKYMLPKYFEYRESLPKTIIGKVNYRELEK